MLPLSDVRVLDLTRLLPGPYATLVMADLGARVDKLEDPQGGDYIRQMPPQRGEESALFYALNRNKRSIALDLKQPHAVAAVMRLLARYDVLVESFRPGVMDKLGLGWESLSRAHPRLILCSISGYGQTGPDRLRAGHDLNYVARAGALAYAGERGGSPSQPGVQVGDIGGGSLFSLVGILAALHERARTGRGRWLDVSMTEGALAFIHMQLGARLAMGAEGRPLRRGEEALNGGYPCYGVYRTQDGRFLSVGSLEPKFWSGVCEVLGRPDLAPLGWDAGEAGARAREEVQRIFASAPAAEWQRRFAAVDLCVERVNEGDEVLDDPQLRARGMFLEADDPQRGWTAVRHVRTPVRMGELPLEPPPALGQHTGEILAEAGFSAEEIRALRS
ncbi:MAG TPA: CaiB/BaiF CoA-transferase family protein [Myxococcaceae bacterium]|nr:CaiB/BaiF CoA-transferase family protein [Myxococcaceae bacterium]